MHKWYFLLVAVTFLFSACKASTEQMAAVQEGRDTEEYAVYSTVINRNYSGWQVKSLYLILDQTSPYIMEDEDSQYLRENLTSVLQTTLDDYKAVNTESYPLIDRFSLVRRYALLTQKDLDGIFESGLDGWEEFHTKYPGSLGYITLSRADFNPEMDQALVYMAFHCGQTCGTGDLYFLIKYNETWVIRKVIPLWIS